MSNCALLWYIYVGDFLSSVTYRDNEFVVSLAESRSRSPEKVTYFVKVLVECKLFNN